MPPQAILQRSSGRGADSGVLIEFRKTNSRAAKDGGIAAVGQPLLIGVPKASLSTDRFAYIASSQHVARALMVASATGNLVQLRGSKETVTV